MNICENFRFMSDWVLQSGICMMYTIINSCLEEEVNYEKNYNGRIGNYNFNYEHIF